MLLHLEGIPELHGGGKGGGKGEAEAGAAELHLCNPGSAQAPSG